MTIRNLWDDGDPHAPAGFTAWGEAITNNVDDGWIPYRPGFYMGLTGGTAAETPAAGALWGRALPVVGGRGVTIDQLACRVVTAAASSVVRLGVYRLTPHESDFAELVLDAGTVDSSTGGDKTLALGSALHLDQGAYMLVGVPQGGTPALQLIRGPTASTVAGFLPILHSTVALSGGNDGQRTWVWSGISGALPATLSSTVGHTPHGAVLVIARIA